ncbi:MAG: DUF4388 domain-containing protein [Acidobacteriota bacterium]
MQGKTVLIVHSDDRLAELLSGILQESGLHALKTNDLSGAETTFRYFEPDLVLVELQPLRRASPDARQMLAGADTGRRIPLLALLTALDGEVPLDELGADGSVKVPLRSVEVLNEVRRHLAPGDAESLSGQLSRVGVTDLLTMFDMGRRSGRIKLDDGRRRAWVRIVDGDVVDGGIEGGDSGADVINELLDWKRGEFQVLFGEDQAGAGPAAQSKAPSAPLPDATVRTSEVRLENGDRSFLRGLVEETGSGVKSEPEVEAAPTAQAPDGPAPGRAVSEGELAAHQALTLLNAVSSYASGFSEQRLLHRKLEGVRQRLVRSYGTLSAFEVSSDATVGLRADFEASDLGSRSVVEGCAEWLIAFGLELDRTFPGSMPRATLHILAESVISEDDRFGFMKLLGFGGGGRQGWS